MESPSWTPRRKASLEHACLCARICEEYRGKDTIVLDLTRVTPVMDYFVITTGSSPRQMHALLEEIRVQLKARGERAIGTEGTGQSNWALQDWGDVVVHVFLPEARELYNLEHLWGDAPRVDWASVPVEVTTAQ